MRHLKNRKTYGHYYLMGHAHVHNKSAPQMTQPPLLGPRLAADTNLRKVAMSIDAVTLTQMRYALALGETRNFSHAARSCHVTQSTLSIQIQKMEELLGVQVFDRLKKPVQPTAIGTDLLRVFSSIIQATDTIPYLVDQKSRSLSGRLRLGVIPTVAPFITPVLALAVSSLDPSKGEDLQLSIGEVQTSLLLEQLEQGDIDAAILADSPRAVWMDAALLYEEAFLVYCNPQHHLVAAQTVKSEDLDASEAWILREGHCFGTQSMGLCTAARREREGNGPSKRRLQYSSGTFDTLVDVVNATAGFTLLPFLYCRRHNLLKLPQLKAFAEPVPVRQIYYIHRRECPLAKAHDYIKRIIDTALPSEVRPSSPKGGQTSRTTQVVPVFSES